MRIKNRNIQIDCAICGKDVDQNNKSIWCLSQISWSNEECIVNVDAEVFLLCNLCKAKVKRNIKKIQYERKL